MTDRQAPRPELSYVLAAITTDEVDNAVSWLRRTTRAPEIEIVLAAPASVLARVAGRMIPPRVRLASAINPPNRKAVRLAGAQLTTGLVVMVVDCDEDIASRANVGATPPAASIEDAEIGSIQFHSREDQRRLPRGIQPDLDREELIP
jgi:hypothetical protein